MARPSRMQLRLAGARGRQTTPAKVVALHGSRVTRVVYDELAENDRRIAALNPSDKGKQGRNCNVTACQRPNAWFLNSGTRAYYCFDCAWDIRKFNLRRNSDDGFILFEQWEEDLARFEEALKVNTRAREQYVAERLKS